MRAKKLHNFEPNNFSSLPIPTWFDKQIDVFRIGIERIETEKKHKLYLRAHKFMLFNTLSYNLNAGYRDWLCIVKVFNW